MARTSNPQYNPRWEELYNSHIIQCERIGEEIKAIDLESNEQLRGGRHGYSEYHQTNQRREQLEAERRKALDSAQLCLSTYQHKTIQDAALWYLQNITGVSELKRPYHVDLEQFKTLEEVFFFFNEYYELQRNKEDQKIFSSQTAPQPEPGIFNPETSDDISYGEQSFDVRELLAIRHYIPSEPDKPYTEVRALNAPFQVQTVIDQRDGHYHICFFEGPKNSDHHQIGISVRNNIDVIASIIRERVCPTPTVEEIDDQPKLRSFVPSFLKSIFTKNTGRVQYTHSNGNDQSEDIFHFYRYDPSDQAFAGINISFTCAEKDDNKNFPSSFTWKTVSNVPAYIEKLYKELYPIVKDDAQLLDAILGEKRDTSKPYENIPIELQYIKIADAWNRSENNYRHDMLASLRDFIKLEKTAADHSSRDGRMYSVMRNIVSEFENYALDTAEQFLYYRGLEGVDSKLHERFMQKFQQTNSFKQAARFAVRDHFKKMRAGTRTQNILNVFRDIGYPVVLFEELQKSSREKWHKELDACIDSIAHPFFLQTYGREILQFSDNIDNLNRLIFTRNEIEHEKKYATVTDVDFALYFHSIFLTMNQLKRAYDFYIEDNSEWDTINNSSLSFSPTLDIETLSQIIQNSKQDNVASLLEILEKWIENSMDPHENTEPPIMLQSPQLTQSHDEERLEL